MKKLVGLVAILVLVGAFFAVRAFAFHGHHGGCGRGFGQMAAIKAVLTADQKNQIRQIIEGEKPTIKNLHLQQKTARDALFSKLLSSDKTVDVSAEVTQLKQAQAAQIDEKIKIAQQARALLSPDQLTKAGQIWANLESLHKQEHDLLHPGESSPE